MEGKKVALMSACEEVEESFFQGMEFAFDESFKLLKAEIVGKVFCADIGGSFRSGAFIVRRFCLHYQPAAVFCFFRKKRRVAPLQRDQPGSVTGAQRGGIQRNGTGAYR